jgi:hypothetical protein
MSLRPPSHYLVLLVNANDIRVRCKNTFIRGLVTDFIDGWYSHLFKATSSWEKTRCAPEGGLFDQLFGRGDIDPNTIKRKLKTRNGADTLLAQENLDELCDVIVKVIREKTNFNDFHYHSTKTVPKDYTSILFEYTSWWE